MRESTDKARPGFLHDLCRPAHLSNRWDIGHRMMPRPQDCGKIFLGSDRRYQWRAGGRRATTRGLIVARPAGRPRQLGHGVCKRQLDEVMLMSTHEEHWTFFTWSCRWRRCQTDADTFFLHVRRMFHVRHMRVIMAPEFAM